MFGSASDFYTLGIVRFRQPSALVFLNGLTRNSFFPSLQVYLRLLIFKMFFTFFLWEDGNSFLENTENVSLIQGKIGFLKRKLSFVLFLYENHFLGGNFMRERDCSHSRTLKMLPWFREKLGFWSENCHFSHFQKPNFFSESGAHYLVPEPEIGSKNFRLPVPI